MKQVSTINELIEVAHAAAKEKGFWDGERNLGELLMFIVSECGKAMEAHRKGKRADLSKYSDLHEDDLVEFSSLSFQVNIKDTFEDELADIVIWIADLCGSLDHTDVAKMFRIIHTTTVNKERIFSGDEDTSQWGLMDMAQIPSHENVGEALLSVCEAVVHAGSRWVPHPLNNLTIAMSRAVSIAKAHNIDLLRHINLKLAYNATRPKLHGKAY